MPTNIDTDVRNYLQYLSNPDVFRDPDAASRYAAEARTVTDPLERLTVLQKAREARTGNGEGLRARFVASAKRFVETHRISVDTLREMGVPAGDLIAAGVIADVRPGTHKSAALTAIENRKEAFTIRDIIEESGADRTAVLRAIDDLTKTGDLVEYGQIPRDLYDRTGVRPVVYGKPGLTPFPAN